MEGFGEFGEEEYGEFGEYDEGDEEDDEEGDELVSGGLMEDISNEFGLSYGLGDFTGEEDG